MSLSGQLDPPNPPEFKIGSNVIYNGKQGYIYDLSDDGEKALVYFYLTYDSKEVDLDDLDDLDDLTIDFDYE